MIQKLRKLTEKASFWQKFNLALTLFWILLIPIAFLTGLANLTWFVTLISLIALALASQSSWQASRNEHKEDVRDPETPTDD